MPNIMAGSLGGQFPALDPARLGVASLVVNNICNLRCRHCYLEPSTELAFLSSDEWRRLLPSLLGDLKPQVVCFAGKEIFAREDSAQLLWNALGLRDETAATPGEETRIGVITNGTLLERYHERLKLQPPDHIDVSVDGLPGAHDQVRGRGAFDRLRPNLRWLVEHLPDRLWLTHTLLASNLDAFPEFIEWFAEQGVRHFALGAYKLLPHTDHGLEVQRGQLTSFATEALDRLSSIRVPDGTIVQIDLDLTVPELTEALDRAGWIETDAVLGCTTHSFGNGLTLRTQVTRIPTGYWRAVRVTGDGYWIGGEDTAYVEEYPRRAACNVRDYGFDAVRAYEAGLAHAALLGRLPSEASAVAVGGRNA